METLTIVLLAAGAGAAALGWFLCRRGRWWRIAAAVGVWLLAAVLLAAGGYSFWYHHRPLPTPVRQVLFEGVTYIREVRRSARPVVVHVITVDLGAPGIGSLVTPPEPFAGRDLRARTTSMFLRTFRVQVAINGSFFQPWQSNGPFDYYPHAGDPVDVVGLTLSEGRAYGAAMPSYPTLSLTKDNRAAIGPPLHQAWNALSGGPMLVDRGSARTVPGSDPQPRTAAALDKGARHLMLFVVDGRQPNYSEGVTLAELANIILDHGGYTALNLDGGGSSTLAIEGPDGQPQVLNTPIHGRVPPGRERPIANHLGIFARPK
jgi:hypothetical protein